MSDSILSLDHLGVRLPAGADRPHALSDVSLSIALTKSSAWSANPVPASR